MGATDAEIKRIFVWQGVFSGVLGSVVGGVLGVVVAFNLTTLIKGLEHLIGHQFYPVISISKIFFLHRWIWQM